MSEMSNATAKYRAKYTVFKLLSIAVTILPLIIYLILGFANGKCGKGDKIFLSFTVIMAILLTVTNLLFKYHLRSPMFILLLGVYKALQNILPLIMIISLGTILDEFIFTPAAKRAKEKLTINKELDNRL